MTLEVLGVLLTIGLLTVGMLALRVNRRALFPPKRRIDGRILNITRLVTSIDKVGLKVFCDGSEVGEPHLITYSIRSVGRHSIANGSFDQGGSIVITFGDSRVVADLTAPGEVRALCIAGGNQIRIDPDLLRRQEENLFTCLLDGRPSRVDIDHHLIDETSRTISITLEQQAERLKRFYCRALAVSLVMATVNGIFVLMVARQAVDIDHHLIDETSRTIFITLERAELLKRFYCRALAVSLVMATVNGIFVLMVARQAVSDAREAQDLARRALQLSDKNYQLFHECSKMLTKALLPPPK